MAEPGAVLPNRAREGQLSMGGRAPPPRKQQAADGGAGGVGGVPGQLPGVQQHQHVPGGRRVSAPARQYLAQQQLQGRRRGPEIFEFPPHFEYVVARQVAFFKRAFSPSVLLEPLPPALRLSLERNFSFFTRIFTQFIDPHQQKEVRQAIPGLGRRDQ